MMPILSWETVRFTFYCNQGDNHIPRLAGFHYDHINKCWWTGLLSIAKKLEPYGDSSARIKFREEADIVKQSWATDSTMNIPVPEGKAYLPFQKAAIEFASKRKYTLIADEMGCGKTIEALGVINLFPEIKNILIIPPASLRLNWGKEIKNWVVRKLSGGYAYAGNFPDTNIVIINYDIVKKFRKSHIDGRRWDLVITDESHYLKNPATQRTRSVLGYHDDGQDWEDPIDAGMWIFLTGTPMLNRPAELWPMLHVADPTSLGINQWLYYERFCKPWQQPWDGQININGSDNLEELQERLRSSIMVRRLKRDVLKELPPKRRQVIAIPPETAKSAIKNEYQYYEKNQQVVDRAVAKLERQAGDEASYRLAVMRLDGESKVAFTQMAALRKATALAKLPFLIDFAEDVLQQEEKIVIFAHHHEVVDQIHQHFHKIAVKMHGGVTSVVDRQAAVDAFQENPKIRVIVGTIGTMGVGWTLTKASYCLFGEMDWVPALITQAEDRLHRITQIEPVLIHHFVFDGSLDAYMAQKTVEKQQVIDAALDNRPVGYGQIQ